MWPILMTSIVALTVVIERFFFIVGERIRRDPRTVREILEKVEGGDYAGAARIGEASKDFVARTLTYALTHRDKSVSDALLWAGPVGSSSDSTVEFAFWIPPRFSVCWEPSRE